tara:strand:- start:31756 stop:32709 length:954 start_codon:yes stop_codon:yes gene_type:complete
MTPKVYIDGHAGTTGLRIRDWLAGREDVALLTIAEEHRKDPAARRDRLLEADVAVLCLPDDAAREAVEWAGNGSTRILDASTAHRVADGWVYGLAEMDARQRGHIRDARFVANPGCYPTGVILLVRPLIDAGMLPADAPVSVHALSGYSGGGRNLIERWEDPQAELATLPFDAPYAMERMHKHIPEMQLYSGLSLEPQFVPSVGPFRCGMRVQLPLNAALLDSDVSAARMHEALTARFANEPFVLVAPLTDGGFNELSFDPRGCNDTNSIRLEVVAHPSGHVVLIATLDNLGKGASGAAIQNMNLMLGFDETTGLAA